MTSVDIDTARSALDLWRTYLADPQSADPGKLTWMVDLMLDRRVRDALMLSIMTESTAEIDRLLQGDDSGVDNLMALAPDFPRLERGRSLLRAMRELVTPPLRAEPVAILAYLEWWSGSPDVAMMLAISVEMESPDHRLAGLTYRLCNYKLLPEWMQVRGES